jgi:hypothetical protein
MTLVTLVTPISKLIENSTSGMGNNVSPIRTSIVGDRNDGVIASWRHGRRRLQTHADLIGVASISTPHSGMLSIPALCHRTRHT